MSDVQTPFQLLVDIDQRCRRLAAGLPAQQEAVQSWSGIGFRMGGRFFVAPMGEVGEVLHEPRYTQLPGVKTWVKGVANVRGRLLPIMDLCGFLGTELSSLRKQRRVLVVDTWTCSPASSSMRCSACSTSRWTPSANSCRH